MRLVRASGERREIHLEGLVVRTVDPAAGGDKARRFVSHAKARAAFDAAVAAARADGFIEAPDAQTDLEARRVLADELQLRGDWRGELITIQDGLAGTVAGTPGHAALAARATELLVEHHAELYGPLAPIARKADDRAATTKRAVEVTFARGFAATAKLQAIPGHPLVDTYRALVALPLGRELVALELGVPATGRDDASYAPIVHAMLATGVPPNLARLAIGTAQSGAYHVGDLVPLVAAIPQLERLFVSGRGEIGELVAPRLRELALVHLGATGLLRARLPALTSLTLELIARAGAFVDALARSPLLAQLETLAIRRSGLHDAGLATILMHEARYRHVKRLDLRQNDITAARLVDARDDLPGLVLDAPALGR